MKIKTVVKKEGNRTLLLYFCGWGTTPEAVGHLELPKGWDYVAFYDYQDISSPLPDFTSYDTLYLVAWSMGVWAADTLAQRGYLSQIDCSVAVNGTTIPMHDQYGIPIPIFEATLKGLNEESREKFDRRMVGGKKLLEVYRSFHARSTDDLKGELLGVYHAVSQMRDLEQPTVYLPWSKALVSEKDLIIPPDNQRAFWDSVSVPVVELKGAGHYPFLGVNSWDSLF